MRLPIHLTCHARIRLEERTKLQEDAFISLLARYQTVSVGYREKYGHWHRLFYSEPDQAHFVAIQDLASGDVITILTIEYHENLAWKITEKQKRLAIFRVAPDAYYSIYPVSSGKANGGIKMEITGVFFPNKKKINFGSHRFDHEPKSAEEALSDDSFVSNLFEKLRKRGPGLSYLDDILLFERHTCVFLKIQWHALDEFSPLADIKDWPNNTCSSTLVNTAATA